MIAAIGWLIISSVLSRRSGVSFVLAHFHWRKTAHTEDLCGKLI
jgi:hypothetical protein